MMHITCTADSDLDFRLPSPDVLIEGNQTRCFLLLRTEYQLKIVRLCFSSFKSPSLTPQSLPAKMAQFSDLFVISFPDLLDPQTTPT
mmetsp:Transcript_7069/g.8745  ORF Transcript_7069/g.8745 Transcript_7069/m.8745 type:complete len:87 (-) Transcript_7069:976-1236(-)